MNSNSISSILREAEKNINSLKWARIRPTSDAGEEKEEKFLEDRPRDDRLREERGREERVREERGREERGERDGREERKGFSNAEIERLIRKKILEEMGIFEGLLQEEKRKNSVLWEKTLERLDQFDEGRVFDKLERKGEEIRETLMTRMDARAKVWQNEREHSQRREMDEFLMTWRRKLGELETANGGASALVIDEVERKMEKSIKNYFEIFDEKIFDIQEKLMLNEKKIFDEVHYLMETEKQNSKAVDENLTTGKLLELRRQISDLDQQFDASRKTRETENIVLRKKIDELENFHQNLKEKNSKLEEEVRALRSTFQEELQRLETRNRDREREREKEKEREREEREREREERDRERKERDRDKEESRLREVRHEEDMKELREKVDRECKERREAERRERGEIERRETERREEEKSFRRKEQAEWEQRLQGLFETHRISMTEKSEAETFLQLDKDREERERQRREREKREREEREMEREREEREREEREKEQQIREERRREERQREEKEREERERIEREERMKREKEDRERKEREDRERREKEEIERREREERERRERERRERSEREERESKEKLEQQAAKQMEKAIQQGSLTPSESSAPPRSIFERALEEERGVKTEDKSERTVGDSGFKVKQDKEEGGIKMEKEEGIKKEESDRGEKKAEKESGEKEKQENASEISENSFDEESDWDDDSENSSNDESVAGGGARVSVASLQRPGNDQNFAKSLLCSLGIGTSKNNFFDDIASTERKIHQKNLKDASENRTSNLEAEDDPSPIFDDDLKKNFDDIDSDDAEILMSSIDRRISSHAVSFGENSNSVSFATSSQPLSNIDSQPATKSSAPVPSQLPPISLSSLSEAQNRKNASDFLSQLLNQSNK